MWTPSSRFPLGSSLTCKASSMSLQPGGSTLHMGRCRRSSLQAVTDFVPNQPQLAKERGKGGVGVWVGGGGDGKSRRSLLKGEGERQFGGLGGKGGPQEGTAMTWAQAQHGVSQTVYSYFPTVLDHPDQPGRHSKAAAAHMHGQPERRGWC